MKRKIKNIWYRIYNDYFMKDRFKEYEKLIESFINHGYEFITISEYDKLKDEGKHIIIRHDIDSDVNIAKKMFEIEKKHNVKATYFFRIKTFDECLIKSIVEYGSEVGYHYEEIATFCKKNKIKSREEAMEKLDEIRKIFANNLFEFQKKFNLELKSIAAHGDFLNRKFNLPNYVLFDEKMRKKFPNIVEAYDDIIEKNLDFRIADEMYPTFWKPSTPSDGINGNKKNMLFLIHTRYWDKNPIERLKLDFLRLLRR